MNLIRCVQITNEEEAAQHLEALGVDSTRLGLMQERVLHLHLKVEGVSPRIANLLKQEMMAQGGDAIVDQRGLDCETESADVLLMGTRGRLEQLVSTLNHSPQLSSLAHPLSETMDNFCRRTFSLRLRSKTFELGKRTLLMGILNVTPDSFSDGGRYLDRERAIARGRQMMEEGADLIDIGGESTRPGSKPVPVEEELRRVIPVIEGLAKEGSVPISIDTYKSLVAERAIDAGAEMINDISGLHADPVLAQVAAKHGLPIVLMHMRGTPETMQRDTHYESLFSEILLSLKASIERAESSAIDPDQIVIDPGIGFGKSAEQNLLLIKHLSEFRVLGKPILLGTSRKSFIGKVLNEEVDQRLEGTLATIAIGILNGAHIVRCHDVLPARKVITMVDAIRLAEGA